MPFCCVFMKFFVYVTMKQLQSYTGSCFLFPKNILSSTSANFLALLMKTPVKYFMFTYLQLSDV